jgi:hypothetical protein
MVLTRSTQVIFPFHPIAIYTNAALLKYLLDPLFINQEAGNWPNKYAIHDIGAAFPNATGTFEYYPRLLKYPGWLTRNYQATQMAKPKTCLSKNAET